MSEGFRVEGVWRPIEYAEAWAGFDARFDFKPDYYERAVPAIRLPDGCVVIDLAPVFAHEGARFASGEAAITAAALRNFVWFTDEEELTALDWQHTPYRYSPAAHALANVGWPVPVFPNGDYYVHTTSDLRWGTFGHPWQQSLTVWGEELVRTLGTELLTWLPRHTQSP
ncbi:Protein of unknown function [Actinopolymorpha cephalotaxi]|uniref:DUF2716 domain-containing protein n=1 Tax=Actinopolymorpha cephalotaxi TaxID=504797 RepID=A0A1I3C6I9_9ACTN|nr:DUF2716 domain-containing protein [Actinopolymorpha cephalotaxi]NYH86824.1 hypothetical protein [Actinopolymorpha cephalotaxi]SFH70152.1 Protein of unknown function [Actinopolymorpha cephalotaxi]